MDLKTTYKIDTQVKGASQLAGLKKGMKGVSDQTNKTASAMSKLKTSAGGAMNAMRGLLPLIGTAAIGKLVNDTLQLGDSLEKMSGATGVSVPLLDKLRQSAALAGTDFKALQRAFPTLAKNMQDASDGTGTAKEAFDRLGFSVTGQDGKIKDLDTAILELTDKFAQMPNGTMKAANAAEIFGTGLGRKLIPLLNQGRAGIEGLNTGFSQMSAERMAKFNDSMSMMGESLRLVAITLTDSLLPILEKVVGVLSVAATWFSKLPGPIQTVVIGFGALAGAAIALAPLLAGLILSIKTIKALKISGLVTSMVGGLGSIGGAISGLMPVLAGLFTGPVGWIALLTAAGVAIWHFRDEIGQGFQAIGQVFAEGWQIFKTAFLEPIQNGSRQLIDFLGQMGQRIGQTLRAPFEGIGRYVSSIYSNITTNIRNQMTSLFNWAVGLYNRAIAMINRARSVFSGGGKKGKGKGRGKRAAAGGVFDSPTFVHLGEGGQGEYVVPFSKAGAFARNIMGGVRGASAIPRMAEGGVVMPSTANVSIQTGPVTQMDNQQFITTTDMRRAVQDGIDQTLSMLRSDMQVRRRVGLA